MKDVSRPDAAFASRWLIVLAEVFDNAIRDQELGVFGPAIDALGQLNFLGAERFAVGGGGIVFIGANSQAIWLWTMTNVGRSFVFLKSSGSLELFEVVGIFHAVTFQP